MTMQYNVWIRVCGHFLWGFDNEISDTEVSLSFGRTVYIGGVSNLGTEEPGDLGIHR